MNNLPFVEPDREFLLNVSVTLILLDALASTKKGKLCLTKDKLRIFLYLSLHPQVLKKVLSLADKENLELETWEYFTVSTLSHNVDVLFYSEKIDLIVNFLAVKNMIEVSYSSKDGFLYSLSAEGEKYAGELSGDYFHDVRRYINNMKSLQSTSVGQLSGYLNDNLIQAL